jgi:hypothetical protein
MVGTVLIAALAALAAGRTRRPAARAGRKSICPFIYIPHP